MAYAFDDEDLPLPPTRVEVEAELSDWRNRLTELFEQLQKWLPGDGSFEPLRGDRFILEERMKAVGISVPRPFPTLDIGNADVDKGMQLIPDARWVFLTRGRLFLFHPLGMTYVEDHGIPGAPDWRLYPHRDRSRDVPLNRQEFQRLLDGLR